MKVLPLSFKEFIDFKSYDENDAEEHFNEYLRIGSFLAVSLVNQEALVDAILSGLFDSIFTIDKIDLSKDGIIHLNLYDFLLERTEFKD